MPSVRFTYEYKWVAFNDKGITASGTKLQKLFRRQFKKTPSSPHLSTWKHTASL